jgi:hypothetical protein
MTRSIGFGSSSEERLDMNVYAERHDEATPRATR